MRVLEHQAVLVASFLLMTLSAGPIVAAPTYDSDQTRETVERLIDAHGGLDAWRKAKTLSYDNLFFNPSYEQFGWPSPYPG